MPLFTFQYLHSDLPTEEVHPGRYTLFFPFESRGSYAISSEDRIRLDVEKVIYTFHLPKEGLAFVNVDGLHSPEQASEYVSRIWAGLNWAMLKLNTSLGMVTNELKTEPIDGITPDLAARNLSKSVGLNISGGVHGTVQGVGPVTFESQEGVLLMMGGHATVVVGVNPLDFAHHVTEVASRDGAAGVLRNDRLKLALDLFSAHFVELSERAQFLTLTMVLEVLAPSVQKHQVAQELLDRWESEVEQEVRQFGELSEERCALDSLKRELVFRRNESIRGSIRQYVRDTLLRSGADPEDAAQTSQEAVEFYDLRSRLVHTGRLENVSRTIAETRKLINRILIEVFNQATHDQVRSQG